MFKKISVIFVIIFISCCFTNAIDALSNDDNIELIQSIDDLDSEKSLYLFNGLSIEKIENTPRTMDNFNLKTFTDRAIHYLKTHTLKFSMSNIDNHIEEARTGKLKKIALPLLLALKLKFATILPIVLFGLALISSKGLAAGLLALLFSGATFVKDLLSKKEDRVTTAYINGNYPVNAEIVHRDWNRNGQVSPQELAYNYHTLPQSII